jgi:integrase
VIHRYVLGHRIAKRKVRDLTPRDFRALYRDLAEHGKQDGSGLAAGTIATLSQVLKSALQRLVDDQELHWNPIPRRAVAIERTERPWLRPEQVRELIRFARFRDPDLEVVLRLGALAGLRRGEICGLRWSDLDLVACTATIRSNRTVANGRVSETSPKTAGSMATVNLDPGTVETLERHRRRRADLIEQDVPLSEHVVCSPIGDGREITSPGPSDGWSTTTGAPARAPSFRKPHGSINWGRLVGPTQYFEGGIRSVTGHALDGVQEQDEITLLQLRNEGLDVVFMKDDRYYVPAIAPPMTGKQRFVCPQGHIDTLMTDLHQVDRCLVIGWAAGESNFLSLWRDNCPRPTAHVVSSNHEDAGLTATKLKEAIPNGDFTAIAANGFSDFAGQGVNQLASMIEEMGGLRK